MSESDTKAEGTSSKDAPDGESMCDLVALFLEGKLSPELEERYQHHLATCTRCQEAFQVGVLVEGLARRPQKVLQFVRRHGPSAMAALAATLLLAVGGRLVLGMTPVALNPGKTRPTKAWVEGPFAEAHRPFERSSTANLGNGTSSTTLIGSGSEYYERLQRISWLFGYRKLLAGAASALHYQDERHAQELLQELLGSASADAETMAKAFNNHAVLELQRADRLRGESCAEVHAPEVQAEEEGVCDKRMRHLREALAYLEMALERTPGRPSALFNRGLVLERLGLELSAVVAFEAVARSGQEGWAKEAAGEVERLRPALEQHRLLIERTEAVLARLSEAVSGAAEGDPGAVSRAQGAVQEAVELVHRLKETSKDPEPLRMKVYELARVGTPLQRTLLVPLAEALGDPDPALVRRLTGYAPALAPAHAQLVARYQRRDQLTDEELATLANDLARAGEVELFVALLGPDPAVSGRKELPLKEGFLEQAEREEPFLAVRAGRIKARRILGSDPGKSLQLLEELTQTCQPRDYPERCAAVEAQLFYAYITLERWTQAQTHGLRALAHARRTPSAWSRPTLLRLMADVASAQNDPWLALAYGEEARLTAAPDPSRPNPSLCVLRSEVAERMAAVRLYFLLDAKGALQLLGEAVEPKGCARVPLSETGAGVLGALAAIGEVPPEWRKSLDDAVRGLAGTSRQGARRYINDYVAARAARAHNRPASTAALVELVSQIEAAGAPRSEVEELSRRVEELSRKKARSYAYRDLALDAGEAADPSGHARAFELVARQLGIRPPDSCALAVVSDLGRTVAVAKDERGAVVGSVDRSQWRWVDRRGDLLVPVSVREALRGCRRVKVLASPGVFGLSRVLPELPWSYAVAQRNAPRRDEGRRRRLVVANVASPLALRLEQPELLSIEGREPDMVVLEGRDATLTGVLRELPAATEVEMYMHGLQKPNDAEGSYLVLTPDPARKGEYRLTGRDVQQLTLDGAPDVYLKACVAADVGFKNWEARSLASAFVEAGARSVFAATVSIPDVGADLFFNAIRERVRHGLSPAEALFETRASLKREGRWQEWMEDVVCLEPA